WDVYRSVAPYLRRQLDGLFKGYYRDLQQSQPNHIEIIGEKNTIEGVLRPVAMEYTIPYTIGRGYTSLPLRYEMVQRFKRSGKDNLVLLVLSDFGPEGEDVGHSFARSLRDDFGVKNIAPIKVALTANQVRDLGLPPKMKAKEKSSRYEKFVERHGDDVFELEAIRPQPLQGYLPHAIDSVMEIEAFKKEIDAEKEDAADLARHRGRVHAPLGPFVGAQGVFDEEE